jgi:hypothetical protein
MSKRILTDSEADQIEQLEYDIGVLSARLDEALRLNNEDAQAIYLRDKRIARLERALARAKAILYQGGCDAFVAEIERLERGE